MNELSPLTNNVAEAKKINVEDRLKMINTAAYYRAQHRGFRGEDTVADWLEAESEIDYLLKQSPVSEPSEDAVSKPVLIARLASELRELDAQRKELVEKASDVKKSAQARYKKQMDAFVEKHDGAQRWLQELKDSSAMNVEDIKQQAKRIWDELLQAIEQAKSHLK